MYRRDEIRIIRTYRFEGNSNPADEAIRASDGTIGYSLDAYCVYSNYQGGRYANTIHHMQIVRQAEARMEMTFPGDLQPSL